MPSHNKTHKIWKKCQYVPCGGVMDKCRPHYCVSKRGSSKNWGNCNMEHIVPKKFKHNFSRKCKKEKKARPTKQKIMKKTSTTFSVDADVMHKKMPYIWRHLDNKTRRNLIRLARKPLKEINIIPKITGPMESNKHL